MLLQCAQWNIFSVSSSSLSHQQNSHHTWSTFIIRPPLYRPAPHLFHTSPFCSVTQLVTSGLNSRRRWAGKERGGGEELHNDTLRCTQTGGTLHKDCQLAKPDTRHFSVHMHVHTYVCTHLSSSEGKLKEQRGKGGGREVDWFLSTCHVVPTSSTQLTTNPHCLCPMQLLKFHHLCHSYIRS